MTGRLEREPLWRERGGARRLDVVGIGQNALDRIGSVVGALRPGEKRPLAAFQELPGGQVATAVLTCARLGLRCAYVGSVGDDPAGAAVLAPLRAAGIDVGGVVRVAGAPTQTALILVDPGSGERTILWYRAEALRLAPAALDRGAIESARALLLDAGDPDAAAWAAAVARSAGIPVILDADRWEPGLDPLLERVDFPLVSRSFAETRAEDGCARETLRMLLEQGARLAAVTLGDRGVVAAIGGDVIEIPAVPVQARDTTGAGDVFHGAFAWGVLAGLAAIPALQAAAAAAAMNCRQPGAQGGIPDRDELASFLRAHGTPLPDHA